MHVRAPMSFFFPLPYDTLIARLTARAAVVLLSIAYGWQCLACRATQSTAVQITELACLRATQQNATMLLTLCDQRKPHGAVRQDWRATPSKRANAHQQTRQSTVVVVVVVVVLGPTIQPCSEVVPE
jgi:hypothetical protein